MGKQLNHSAVEFGGGRPAIFRVPLNRKLLGCFYYEGTMYEYNFSKFWTKAKVLFSFIEGDKVHTWKLIATNKESKLELILKCKREEMLLIQYEAPSGKKLHNRLWNGGTGYGKMKLYEKENGSYHLVDIIEMKHTGCEYGEYDK